MSKGKRLVSTVTSESIVHLSIEEFEVPNPKPDEVLVAVEASPINPSDLGVLLAGAEVSTVSKSENGLVLSLPDGAVDALGGRLDRAMPVGNEGAGIVIDAGSNVKHLTGKTVGLAGGAMYSQYICVPAINCLVMDDETTPAEAASSFVNPMTALSFVETMKMENHSGIVNTAAASNLGQMLVKICIDDGVQLINIVRKQEHVDLLESIGAKFVCNSSDDDFMDQLTMAITETKATLAFDATGGGELAGKILACMEGAARKNATEYSPYGSTDHKQVYIYGGLNQSAITLPNNRTFGMYWGIGGFLLTPFLGKVGFEKMGEMQARVANEIKTTFASRYTKEVTLKEALTLDSLMVYAKQATGEKFLINPNG